MTNPLGVVESAYPAKPTTTTDFNEQLQRLVQLVHPILTSKNRVLLSADDPIGCGPACSVTGCPRTQFGYRAMCRTQFVRWKKSREAARDQWDPSPCPGPQFISLEKLPLPLRWEIAYGIDRARRGENPPSISRGGLESL